MRTTRTIDCMSKIGETVTLYGFINRRRDHGKLLFLELRDDIGIMQVVVEHPSKLITSLGLESVIGVTGIIRHRTGDNDNINEKIATGAIELYANSDDIIIYSNVSNLPFLPNDHVNESLQYRYRPLYLRSNKMQHVIKTRSKILAFLMKLMTEKGFLYIETPTLTSSSSEGARDFIVPSRLHVGKFYALPQSPQIFKQLCMVAGFDKYFQIADCFRDEDPRSDRCYGSFKQLDWECAFANENEIHEMGFDILIQLMQTFSNKRIIKYTMDYDDSIRQYGSDKPDLRNPLFLEDWTSYFATTEMKLFNNMIQNGGIINAVRCTNVTAHRSVLDKIETLYGFKVAYVTKQDEKCVGSVVNFFDESKMQITQTLKEGETLFFIGNASKQTAYKNADKFIRYMGEYLNIIGDDLHLVLIKNFPFFEMQDDQLTFAHNPFSMPQDENLDMNTKAYQYDFVLNGYEVGSGSVRNTNLELLKKVLRKCSIDEEQFKCFDAFKLGVPPHAGCALGVDRLIMILLDLENIRDTQAFPLSSSGTDTLMDCPSTITEKQLRELHIKVVK